MLIHVCVCVCVCVCELIVVPIQKEPECSDECHSAVIVVTH